MPRGLVHWKVSGSISSRCHPPWSLVPWLWSQSGCRLVSSVGPPSIHRFLIASFEIFGASLVWVYSTPLEY